MDKSLKERLNNYLRQVYILDQNAWVHKGHIEELAKKAGYLGDNATRRLREMVAEGQIKHRPKDNSQEYQYIPSAEEFMDLFNKL